MPAANYSIEAGRSNVSTCSWAVFCEERAVNAVSADTDIPGRGPEHAKSPEDLLSSAIKKGTTLIKRHRSSLLRCREMAKSHSSVWNFKSLLSRPQFVRCRRFSICAVHLLRHQICYLLYFLRQTHHRQRASCRRLRCGAVPR